MVINYVEAVTYICLALSPIAAIANITSFFYTKKTFNDNAPYRILQIECAITTVCQFGYIGILLGSLQESPSLAMCISASSVSMFDFSVLYITRTALSRVRYNVMDASHNGNGGNMILTDQKSVFNYALYLTLFFLFYTGLTIIDHYFEFHSIPPLELCVSRFRNSQQTLKELSLYSVAVAPYFLLSLGNMGYSWSLFKSLGDRTQRKRESLHKQIPLREFIFSIILLFVMAIIGTPNYQMNVFISEYKITVCVIILVADILKGPLTIKLAFKVNHKNQRKTKEDRRLAILEHATLEKLNNASSKKQTIV